MPLDVHYRITKNETHHVTRYYVTLDELSSEETDEFWVLLRSLSDFG